MQNRHYTWTKNFQNGDRYNGEATGDNVRDGYGEFFCAANNSTYVGAWLNDKPHGKGKYTIPGDEGYVYEGDFLDGERSGNGTCTFSNGRRYEGEWLRDKMHGKGHLIGAPGVDDYAEYTGPFVQGERSGVDGVCRYANGDVYKGSWLHDKRNGHGELQLDKNSSTPGYNPRMGEAHVISYKGEFENDLPHGIGEFKYSDGSSYRGSCEAYWRQGEGEQHTANDDVYKGSFQCDRRCGKGTLRTKTGEYTGEWSEDALNSHGVFKAFPDFSLTGGLVYYEGPFVCGEMSGAGAVAKYRDGSSYYGEMSGGKPNGKGILDNKRMTIPGIGEIMLRYEGDVVAGVPKGYGTGTFKIITPDPRSAPPPLSEEVRGFLPSLDVSGYYVGNWVGGLPNGEGEWKWEDGDVHYKGTLKAGLPHGEGVFTTSKIVYEGSFSLGFPDGQGKISWDLGDGKEDTYEGGWKEGHLSGKGSIKLHDGSSYIGEWVTGVKEGYGIENVPGNYHYTGNFKDGKRNGKGTLHSEGDGLIYEGDFVMNEITGYGKMQLEDGTVMTGEFLQGKPNGKVEVTLPRCGTFIGEFKNGAVVGRGTLKYGNGDIYEGEFIDSGGPMPLRHGKGVYKFHEGNILECTWKRNVLHGDGIYTTSTGDRSKRSYVEGVLSGVSGASNSNNVFTPENEFPNTFSDDMLKEEQQQRQQRMQSHTSHPPAVTIRRSLPHRSSTEGNTLSNQRLEKRQSMIQKEPKVASRPSVVLTNSNTLQMRDLPITQTVSNPVAATTTASDSQGAAWVVKYLSSRCSLRCKESPEANNEDSTMDEGGRRRRSMSAYEDASARFQKEICKFLGPSSSHDEKEAAAALSQSGISPEKDELMQKALALRNSKEDEIHRLTEEIRQLNERIWQLNFLLCSAPKADQETDPSLTDEGRSDVLISLQKERREIVEKLHKLLL
ncbi:MORN1 protein [Trypanosoma theileri]|uniref:MORN1 protein n=1 Tax=Trypanosoma theileri TaxID=67003 RepID=A0A1X0NZY1_9TRYP|nr:MORN1 protein [Trypanosoma theileri]ORC90235.1 MORN1 protein [Trypanosoma theileri]